MPQKVVLTFSDNQGYGWTETYYYLGSTIPPTADVQNLAYFRNQFLCSEATMNYARITSTVKRNPFIIDLNPNGNSQGALPGPMGPDFAALLVRLISTATGYGRHFLRGIPAANIDEDTYVATPGFNSNFQAWVANLQTGLWGIRSTLNGGGPRTNISFPVPGGSKGYQFFIAGAQVYTLGQVITVHGCRVIGYNGTKTVTAAQATTAPSAGFNYSVGGAIPATPEPVGSAPWATLVNVTYGVINSVVVERITHRSPGRIFGSRRGRRASLVPLRQ